VRIRIFQVDSFTRTQFAGNPAGVVLGADGMTARQMQQVARELNNSETAFVLRPVGTDHDVHVRFFTPTTEVPSCGHATIAAHYARAVEGDARSATLVQLTGAGLMPIGILPDGTDYRIRMTQGPVGFEPPLPGHIADDIRAALGLSREDSDTRAPIRVVTTGHSKVMVPILTRSRLGSLAPDNTALVRISRALGCNGYFVFTFDRPDAGALTQARMFAPAIGIDEDPVTGNGHGPLGAYLVHHRLVSHDGRLFQFRGSQGDATGRSGYVDVLVDVAAGDPSRVSIVGDAVIVFRTEVDMPPRD
jgi:PhzF family phenazine biosynthesis protein